MGANQGYLNVGANLSNPIWEPIWGTPIWELIWGTPIWAVI